MARIFQCTVKVLDEQADPVVIDFKKDARGQYLLDEACSRQNLAEKDYFGLRYIDGEKQRHWLDLRKSIVKQLRGTGPPYTVVFRVKYYPADPDDLKEEITKYHLFLQLKKDLLHGRLSCGRDEAALLGAYIVQSNLRDYDPEEHPPGYASGFQIVPKQSEKLERQIEELHEKEAGGLKPNEAEFAFIKKAFLLETYGIDPHPVRDIYGTVLHIGMNHAGLLVFRANAVVEKFKWEDIRKFSYEGRTFFINAMVSERKVNHGFRLSTSAATKHLWKSSLDHQSFYKFRRSSDVSTHSSGGFFRGSRFRFSGRTQLEVLAKSASLSREEPSFARSPPQIRPRRVQSFKDTAKTPPVDVTFDGFAKLSGSDHSTPIRIKDPFLTYTPAPPDSTDDSDLHGESEDLVDLATPTIQEEPMEAELEVGTEQSVPGEPVPTAATISADELPSNHVGERELAAGTQQQQQQQKPAARARTPGVLVAVLKGAALCVVIAAVLLAAFLAVLYETDAVPSLEPLRRNPAVRDLGEAYYAPARTWIEGGLEQVRLFVRGLPSVDELRVAVLGAGSAEGAGEPQTPSTDP